MLSRAQISDVIMSLSYVLIICDYLIFQKYIIFSVLQKETVQCYGYLDRQAETSNKRYRSEQGLSLILLFFFIHYLDF